MKSKKPFIFLLPLFILMACTQKEEAQIVGKWKYKRMESGDPKTNEDTVVQVLTEIVYEGSVLEFLPTDSFVITNRDTASEFQGKGTYIYNANENTLTMQGGVKATAEDQMNVEVKVLTADSLKIGTANEQIIYSRVKE